MDHKLMLWLQPYGKFISAEKESKRFKKIRDFQSFPKNDSSRHSGRFHEIPEDLNDS